MASPDAVIVNVQRFSTEDGPGIRTTVFFKGCPMRCPWCQNPETVLSKPELIWHGGRCLGDLGCLDVCRNHALSRGDKGLQSDKGLQPLVVDRAACRACRACVEFCPTEALEMHGRAMPVSDLCELLRRDSAFYETSLGGVTLSGGEPLFQPEAAIALLRLLKEAGIHTALDTCGAVSERALAEALPFVDLVLLDIKSVDPAKHEAFTDVPFLRVETAARVVAASQIPVWVRTPIIPGYTDDADDIRAVARFVRDALPHCQRHDLLAFSNLCRSKYEQLDRAFPLAAAPLLSDAAMEHLCAVAREAGAPNVHWSGPTFCGADLQPAAEDRR